MTLQLRPNGPDEYGVRVGEIVKYAAMALGIVVVGTLAFIWLVCRVDIAQGEFVPLLKKTGQNITNADVLAPSIEFKGPQFEVLTEGRHFRNPYRWHWSKPLTATVIEKNHVGVLTRRYGEPLALGQIVVANDEQKGILAAHRTPGRYYLNRWKYDVEIHPMVRIEPGFRGVVTRLVGKIPADSNLFVVAAGERGTQPFLLGAGTYPEYSNPYVYKITPVDVRSHKFEMAGAYGVTFPSKNGFDIKVEGTIEWAPDTEKLPELFVKYVDEEDLKRSGGIDNIQRKVILPFARSYFRIIGGRHRAVDYITGDTRILVQDQVKQRLQEACEAEGIVIRAFVIRATEPPMPIRVQYERREIARREIDRFAKEIETEIGGIVLDDGRESYDPRGLPVREGGRLAKVIQERRKDRETKLGAVRADVAVRVRGAERYQAVEVTKGQRDLEVARIMLEAAKDRAAKTLAEGTAAADVTVMKHQAEAEAVKAKISAFGTGDKYAQYQLIVKFAPSVRRILSNTDGLFARLFERFANLKTTGGE